MLNIASGFLQITTSYCCSSNIRWPLITFVPETAYAGAVNEPYDLQSFFSKVYVESDQVLRQAGKRH